MINDKESMKKAGRRQAELYELTLTTWCNYFPRKFENRAQSHRFNDIHDDLYSSDERIPKFNKVLFKGRAHDLTAHFSRSNLT